MRVNFLNTTSMAVNYRYGKKIIMAYEGVDKSSVKAHKGN